MSAAIVDIADAVVTALNGASLSQSFTAERAYVPVHELRDLFDLRVSVVMSGVTGTLMDRAGRNDYANVVDIGVQKAIGSGPMTVAEIKAASDPIMQLVQEIADLFLGTPLSGYPSARCMAAEYRPIYAPMHLDEMRVFTAVLGLTFRQVR